MMTGRRLSGCVLQGGGAVSSSSDPHMTMHRIRGTANQGRTPALEAGFSSTTGSVSSTTTTGPPARADEATKALDRTNANNVFMLPSLT